MLTITRQLIAEIRSRPRRVATALVTTSTRADFIAKHGSLEDAEVLLKLFLEYAEEYGAECLLEPIMRLGNLDTALSLAAACLNGNQLKEGVRAGVLHALGFLGFAEVRDVLWDYAQHGDWSQQLEASLGLLNLPCDGLEKEIAVAIRGCLGRNLFPEFLPILACKTGDPELPRLLFDLGQTVASTDCNGGLVFGLALYGELGSPYFDRVLLEPHWEAWGPGTGTGRWTYEGFRHLGRRISDLARVIRANHASMPFNRWEFQVRTWVALAECYLRNVLPVLRGVRYPHETAAEIHAAAFEWSSPDRDDSLTGLTLPDGWVPQDELHALAERFVAQIVVENAQREPPSSEE